MIYKKNKYGIHEIMLECACGDENCQIWVSLDKYRYEPSKNKKSSRRWAEATPQDYSMIFRKTFFDTDTPTNKFHNVWYVNFFLQLMWRFKTILKILFKGQITIQSDIIFTDESITDLDNIITIMKADLEYSKYEDRALISDSSKDFLENYISTLIKK